MKINMKKTSFRGKAALPTGLQTTLHSRNRPGGFRRQPKHKIQLEVSEVSEEADLIARLKYDREVMVESLYALKSFHGPTK